ncbi:two-component system regulatory protein YycI [Paenibacillus pasadenensis]|uniref:two-component system regulatory protein YycI n=1 Tax=Paenibacillus pasadenensis TaxID=217090 RepID=UPI000423F3CF|nr:two-component system regulatory protein YycI [Paenibacillus pasadenensis]
MDWGRAKSVLILAFLLLNLLLGYQLWGDVRERVQPRSNSAELSPETLAALKAKRVAFSGVIPKETPELHDLTYRYVGRAGAPASDAESAGAGSKAGAAESGAGAEQPDGGVAEPGVTSGGEPEGITPLETPVDSRVVFQREELLKALGGVIPELDRYELDTLGLDDRKFVLYRMEAGRPMFNVRLELYYSDQRITGYRQDRIELLPADEGQRPQPVLPASRAIRPEVVEKYMPDGAAIKEIRLGYKEGQRFDSETQVSTPSWRILMEDGSSIYLQASSGEVLIDKPEPSPASGG